MSVRDRIKMMEQIAKKEEEAAAERGRSPGGVSSVRSNASDSPRPLSKVRTSFVAIEKDGRIGLQRQPSGDSNISGRKFSGDPEAASTILQDQTRTNVSSPDTSRSELNRGPGSHTVSPSSAQDAGTAPPVRQPPSASASSRPALSGAPVPVSGVAAADPKPADSPARIPPKNTTGTPAKGVSTGSGPARTPSGRQEGLAEPAQIKQAPRGQDAKAASGGRGQAPKESEVPPVPTQAQKKDHGSKGNLNGNGVAAGSAAGEVVPAAVTKAVNGTDRAKASKPAASLKSPGPSSEPKPAVKAPQSTPKRSTTPGAAKPAAEKKTPSTVSPGFVKPRPKSPTRPVKLPASLTTHTAASGQKTRNGGPPPAHQNRPQSRTASTKGLGRSSSVVSRSRPSIGPPPKQTAKDHPVPKKEVKAPDESFLARMMRPTQASANKVAEKVPGPTTPPRTAATTVKRQPSTHFAPTKRAVSKTMSATNSAAGTPEKREEPPKTRTVTRKISQTPIAGGAIRVAKKAEVEKKPEVKELPKPTEKETAAQPTEKVEAPKPIEQEHLPKEAEKQDNAVKAPAQDSESKPEENVPEKPEEVASKPSEVAPAVPETNEITVVPTQKNGQVFKPSENLANAQESISVPQNDLSKPAEKENVPATSDSKPDAVKAPEQNMDGELPADFMPRDLDAERREQEKADASAKSPAKASDALFAQFMNPEAGKTEGAQANGNHKEDQSVGESW